LEQAAVPEDAFGLLGEFGGHGSLLIGW
jgi:hypothetical protein